MSDTPVVPAAPAKPLTAIELIDQELAGFKQQLVNAQQAAERAISQVRTVEGAIQGAQILLQKFKAEAAKAEAVVAAEVEKSHDAFVAGYKAGDEFAKQEASKVVEFVKKEATQAAQEL